MSKEETLWQTCEVKFDYDEDDNSETVEQVVVNGKKYIDIEYFAKKVTELEEQVKILEEDRAIHINTLEMYAKKCKKYEEQLANAIVPKFKIGQEVFVIIQGVVRTTSINSFSFFEGYEISYYCKYVDGERMYLELDESELFATKEEAQAKLKEIQGE